MSEFFQHIIFANPKAFLLLLIPALLSIWYIWRYKKQYPTLKLSNTKGIEGVSKPVRGYLKWLMPLFRIFAMVALITAIARPQTSFKEEQITTLGIDITMVMDVSTSMLAQDFKPNRMEASKIVASEFIDGRPNDRIGLVVFAGESFTQCPITTDHAVLKKQLLEIKNGLIEDGTAIGMGLATAVNRLKDSQAISKVAIVLTDGVNNSGFVDPLTASETAIQFGVRVYTVGVGSLGKAYSPIGKYPNGQFAYDYIDVEIDEDLLKEIAQKTGGKYFRATNERSLREIYDEIDQLEKSKIEMSTYMRKSEEFYPFAFLASIFLMLEIFLRYTLLRSLP